jgi:hypothetical protein
MGTLNWGPKGESAFATLGLGPRFRPDWGQEQERAAQTKGADTKRHGLPFGNPCPDVAATEPLVVIVVVATLSKLSAQMPRILR